MTTKSDVFQNKADLPDLNLLLASRNLQASVAVNPTKKISAYNPTFFSVKRGLTRAPIKNVKVSYE